MAYFKHPPTPQTVQVRMYQAGWALPASGDMAGSLQGIFAFPIRPPSIAQVISVWLRKLINQLASVISSNDCVLLAARCPEALFS